MTLSLGDTVGLEGFKDMMGFDIPTNDVLYEDNPSDNTIPDIQVVFYYYS